MWVLAGVYEPDVPKVRLGQTVSVTLSCCPGDRYEGKITYISDSVDKETRTVKVRAVVPNRGRALKAEMRNIGGGGGGGDSSATRAASSAANAAARQERAEAIAYERAHNELLSQGQRIKTQTARAVSSLTPKNGAETETMGFRAWDAQLRKVEHTGSGVLSLIGVGGGILGVAALVTKEIASWYDTLEKINRRGTETGSAIARSAARAAPGFVESQLKGRRSEWEALGWTPEEAAENISDPSTMAYKQMMRRKELAEMRGGGREGQAALSATMAKSRAAFGRRYAPSEAQAATQRAADLQAERERAAGAGWEAAGVGAGEPTGRTAGFGKAMIYGEDAAWEAARKAEEERRGYKPAYKSGWEGFKGLFGPAPGPQEVVIVGDRSARDGTEGN